MGGVGLLKFGLWDFKTIKNPREKHRLENPITQILAKIPLSDWTVASPFTTALELIWDF